MPKNAKIPNMALLHFLKNFESNMLDAADFQNGNKPGKQAWNSCFQEIFPWEGKAFFETGHTIFLYRNLYLWSTISPLMHSYLVLNENYCKIVRAVCGHVFFTSQSAIGHFLANFFSPLFFYTFFDLFLDLTNNC